MFYQTLIKKILSPKYIIENYKRFPEILKVRLICFFYQLKIFIFKKYFFWFSNEFNILNINKNLFNSNKAFIIGNGPSLNYIDLEKLKKHTTFASNKIFLIYNKTSWRPTFYSVEDDLVLKQNKKKIIKLKKSIKLFPITSIAFIGKLKDALYYNFKPRDSFDSLPYVSDSMINGIYWCGSIVQSQIQLAMAMGFKKIILIGVDFKFEVPKKFLNVYKTIVSSGEINHFHKNYRKKNELWNNPNLKRQLLGYKAIKNFAKLKKIKIYNASKNSALKIFPKKHFSKFID